MAFSPFQSIKLWLKIFNFWQLFTVLCYVYSHLQFAFLGKTSKIEKAASLSCSTQVSLQYAVV